MSWFGAGTHDARTKILLGAMRAFYAHGFPTELMSSSLEGGGLSSSVPQHVSTYDRDTTHPSPFDSTSRSRLDKKIPTHALGVGSGHTHGGTCLSCMQND